MKNRLFVLTLLLTAGTVFFLPGCRRNSTHGLFTALNVEEQTEKAAKSDWISEDAETQNEPFVHISDEWSLFHVISENINADEFQEQILIVKEKNTVASFIELLIVRFDPLSNSYIISDRLKTRATVTENFNVQTIDLTGNFKLDLICQGINAAGEATLDAFCEESPKFEADLPFYRSILSISVPGVIEIQSRERNNPEYIDKTEPGEPFTIIAKRAASRLNFTIEEIYSWNEDEGIYKKSGETTVSDNIRDPSALRRIIGETTDSFAAMIDGAWKFENSNTILFLNAQTEKIELYDYDSIESYAWTQTYNSLNNRFTIQAYTEYIKFLIISLRITVLSPNENLIDVYYVNSNSVTFKKNIPLSGRYTRLDDEEIFTPEKPKSLVLRELSGVYLSEMNRRIRFDGNRFAFSGESASQGYFSLYPLSEKETILCLKTISPTYAVTAVDNYLIDFSETNENGRVTKSIRLTPIRLTVNGAAAIPGAETIQYEQVVDTAVN